MNVLEDLLAVIDIAFTIFCAFRLIDAFCNCNARTFFKFVFAEEPTLTKIAFAFLPKIYALVDEELSAEIALAILVERFEAELATNCTAFSVLLVRFFVALNAIAKDCTSFVRILLFDDASTKVGVTVRGCVAGDGAIVYT